MSKIEFRDDLEFERAQPCPARSWTHSLGWIGIVVLVGGLSYGSGRHISMESIAQAASDARLSLIPTVRTVTAKRAQDAVPIDLPGSLEPFETAASFARASGYIIKRYVDIGTPVKKDDILAIISSPELDQQV
ncbi:MAG: efflux RND transporter periplasmic adaptor subunit, partial [Proteobacteria bacterium]|nr:efflux RND transporter periplasmic adaptor subunit [Pseudomonadota bacterium]